MVRWELIGGRGTGSWPWALYVSGFTVSMRNSRTKTLSEVKESFRRGSARLHGGGGEAESDHSRRWSVRGQRYGER